MGKQYSLVLVAVVFLIHTVVMASVSVTGSVSPSDPYSWDNTTEVEIGWASRGTMEITGGTEIICGSVLSGRTPDGNGTISVDGEGSLFTTGSITMGVWYGTGLIQISNGGAVHASGITLGDNSRAGQNRVKISDSGSILDVGSLRIGSGGYSTMNISNGAVVNSGSGSFASGYVSVVGLGSKWNTGNLSLYTGFTGTLLISEGGLVTANSLTIDPRESLDGPHYINMKNGGMLALNGQAADSLADFLGLVNGEDAIRYWDDSVASWSDMTNATYGVDYTLNYITEGDLAGYTVLTVPEPTTLALLALGGILIRRRK